jgi:hypothetical protein
VTWRQLILETVYFSETSASTDESTKRQNPEEHHQINLLFADLTKAYDNLSIAELAYGRF